jgi:glycosyltransferase involved in cell wall biosynthesis
MESSPQLPVDLVLATVGRTDQVERLLESLVAQSYGDLRVLVVDQNDDDRLEAVLDRFDPRLSILRLRSPVGLSRARNAALSHIRGAIVGFPDDDCWYPPGLLFDVAGALAAHASWDGLSVQARDDRGRRSSMLWDRSAGTIDRYNVWRRAISFSFFLRRDVLPAVGEFAAELGVGSGTRWGSGEETDYLLRALDAGFRIHYEPELFVYHESPAPGSSRSDWRNAYLRGLGAGNVLRRHKYPTWFVGYRVAQLLGGSLAFVALGRPAKARYYLAMALGRAAGWLAPSRPA